MMQEHLPILIPATLLCGALIVVLLGTWKRFLAYPLAVGIVLISAMCAGAGLYHAVVEGSLHYTFGGWLPPIGIEYVLDPLAGFMTMVILVVASLVMIHSRDVVRKELPGREGPYYAVALMLLTGFSGIVLTGDLFNLYVFLEISSLSGYALIGLGGKPSPVAAFRYLLVGSIGASFYLLGLGFLYVMCGSLNMSDVALILPHVVHEPPVAIALALMVIGVGVKAAIFPLHGWVPDAYAFAPSSSAALLAPVGTKVGAYILIRVLFFVFDPAFVRLETPVTTILLWMSLAGIVFGSVMAMAQTEMRRMLAYSSVAQIGYIGAGIGLASPLGLIGAVLHVLNHAFMKSSLFLVAANLQHSVGHTTITRYDRTLRRVMPWTMACFAVSALSMIGIPPTAGFFSKWYLVLGGVEASDWAPVIVILLGSLLSSVYFFRILERAYLRSDSSTSSREESAESEAGASQEVGGTMLVPTLILSFGLLLLGLINALIVNEVIWLMIPRGM